jgi:5-methylcytosine-specific restriction endonuclease McrA
MTISHESAMKLWNKRTKKGVTRLSDRENREIRKEAYGDSNSKYGWNIHHIIPSSKGGTNTENNLEFVHFNTHDEIHGRV